MCCYGFQRCDWPTYWCSPKLKKFFLVKSIREDDLGYVKNVFDQILPERWPLLQYLLTSKEKPSRNFGDKSHNSRRVRFTNPRVIERTCRRESKIYVCVRGFAIEVASPVAGLRTMGSRLSRICKPIVNYTPCYLTHIGFESQKTGSRDKRGTKMFGGQTPIH